jgi:hypothetical protein
MLMATRFLRRYVRTAEKRLTALPVVLAAGFAQSPNRGGFDNFARSGLRMLSRPREQTELSARCRKICFSTARHRTHGRASIFLCVERIEKWSAENPRFLPRVVEKAWMDFFNSLLEVPIR